MFSQTVEYALRAVVYLAAQKEARTTQQIAAVTKVPTAYLAKVLQNLSRTELVRSQRGLHGGFALAKTSSELSIWDVIQAVEPIRRYRGCASELADHHNDLCRLRQKLDDAVGEVERTFRESMIADMLGEPATSQPLRPFDSAPNLTAQESLSLH